MSSKMTDDKGCLYGKYIHKLTWDLDGCVPECPKCAYDKGRKAERERCADIAEGYFNARGRVVAKAIRGGQDAK